MSLNSHYGKGKLWPDCLPAGTQRRNDVVLTSMRRKNVASIQYDVISTSYACWAGCADWSEYSLIVHARRHFSLESTQIIKCNLKLDLILMALHSFELVSESCNFVHFQLYNIIYFLLLCHFMANKRDIERDLRWVCTLALRGSNSTIVFLDSLFQRRSTCKGKSLMPFSLGADSSLEWLLGSWKKNRK